MSDHKGNALLEIGLGSLNVKYIRLYIRVVSRHL